MSGPNTNYDPVQVSALDADQVEARVAEALEAIARASTTAELKQVRITHTGDRSALALANREIGALPPAARKDAGKRIGQARGRVNQALKARQQELAEAELEARLAAETTDVTLPVVTSPQGAPHPITALIDNVCDVFTAMGWEVAEGPEAESEWFNFDALNLGTDHPARALQDTLWLDPVDDGKCMRTATSPVRSTPCLSSNLRCALSARARFSVPMSTMPLTFQSSIKSRDCASTRASPWVTSRAPSTLLPAPCSVPCAPVSVHTTSPSPSPALRSTWNVSSVMGPRLATLIVRAAPAVPRGGSSGAAAGSSTHGYLLPAVSTRTSTPASPLAWASIAR